MIIEELLRNFLSEKLAYPVLTEILDRDIPEQFYLIEKTGGIVRGMSGSPVVQNGKLIGAVTHVLVNDPTTGYGIFIENMLLFFLFITCVFFAVFSRRETDH